MFQKILEEITNADTGAPCSPQHLKKVRIKHIFISIKFEYCWQMNNNGHIDSQLRVR